MAYELNEFERALARFGDKVQLIIGLEIGGKMTTDDAYKEIKSMFKELKRLRKEIRLREIEIVDENYEGI